MTAEPAKRYDTIFSELQRDKIRQFGQRALQRGVDQEFAHTMRTIIGKLETVPCE